MVDESERRRAPRFDVEDVRGRLRTTLDGRVLNLSLEGMALATRNWLSPGRSYTVKLEANGEIVNLNGTVAWCRLARPGQEASSPEGFLYEAGIEFGEGVSELEEELFDVLSRQGITQLERRAHGRFTAVGEDPVSVEATPEFLVHKISRSGLLIESEYVPRIEDRLEAEIYLEDQVLRASLRVAHLRHVRTIDGDPAAEIGAEIVDMSGGDRAIYNEIIDRMLQQ